MWHLELPEIKTAVVVVAFWRFLSLRVHHRVCSVQSPSTESPSLLLPIIVRDLSLSRSPSFAVDRDKAIAKWLNSMPNELVEEEEEEDWRRTKLGVGQHKFEPELSRLFSPSPSSRERAEWVPFRLELSGPLNRLDAILSLLHPLNRYRTPSSIGSAVGRPYLALFRIHAQVGVLNRLVLNRLKGSTAR